MSAASGITLIEGHQVGLELEQNDAAVTGVMLMMGQRQLLEGTYVERTLTLKGEKTEDGRRPPSTAARPADPSSRGCWTTARLKVS